MKEKQYKSPVWALNGVSYEARNKAAKTAKENRLTIGEYVETLILKPKHYNPTTEDVLKMAETIANTHINQRRWYQFWK